MLSRIILILFCLFAGIFSPAAFADETNLLLEPAPDFERSPTFQILLETKPGTEIYELQKIEYLLERTNEAISLFIRNDKSFRGKDAAMHLRWKYARRLKEVQTAEDFARTIADSSRATRRDYKIKMRNGKTFKAKQIFLNELERLEKELRMRGAQ